MMRLPAIPGKRKPMSHYLADQPPPVQLRVKEGRLGIFGEARYRD